MTKGFISVSFSPFLVFLTISHLSSFKVFIISSSTLEVPLSFTLIVYLAPSKRAIACGNLLTFSIISTGVACKNLIDSVVLSFSFSKTSPTPRDLVKTKSKYSPSE